MLVHTEDLATLDILDDAGQPVRVGTLWKERPAVIALVRHFG
jgi:hypothetical protein